MAFFDQYLTATAPFEIAFQRLAQDAAAVKCGGCPAGYAAAGVPWWLEQM